MVFHLQKGNSSLFSSESILFQEMRGRESWGEDSEEAIWHPSQRTAKPSPSIPAWSPNPPEHKEEFPRN